MIRLTTECSAYPNGQLALADTNIDPQLSEIMAIAGPNGVSIPARLAIGLQQPTKDIGEVDDHDTWSPPALMRSSAGLALQSQANRLVSGEPEHGTRVTA